MNTLNALVAGLIMSAHPVPLPPGMYVTTPPYTRPAYARGLSEEQWRAQIMAEARRFCTAYPQDETCNGSPR